MSIEATCFCGCENSAKKVSHNYAIRTLAIALLICVYVCDLHLIENIRYKWIFIKDTESLTLSPYGNMFIWLNFYTQKNTVNKKWGEREYIGDNLGIIKLDIPINNIFALKKTMVALNQYILPMNDIKQN